MSAVAASARAERHHDPKRLVAWFAVACVALSALCYWPILRSGHLGGETAKWVMAIMWAPGLSALFARLVVQRDLRGMGWSVPWRMVALAWLLPALAAVLVYGLVWMSGLGGVDTARIPGTGPIPMRIAFLGTAGVLLSLTRAMGEELGWRGLLLPELARIVTPARAAWISGIAWAVYHYPAILFTDYHSAAPRGYALAVFTIVVFAIAFIMAWLRLRSGSFWPAAMLHASHNLFVQAIFDRATVDGPWTPYLTTEFGAGLCVVYVAVAVVLWRRWPPVAPARLAWRAP